VKETRAKVSEHLERDAALAVAKRELSEGGDSTVCLVCLQCEDGYFAILVEFGNLNLGPLLLNLPFLAPDVICYSRLSHTAVGSANRNALKVDYLCGISHRAARERRLSLLAEGKGVEDDCSIILELLPATISF
jgi:hypothetical protein